MKRLSTLVSVVIVAAIGVYCLNRGVFVGSVSYTSEGLVHKYCRYLFITGISQFPARGGPLGRVPMFQGMRLESQPDDLYCRVFAE